MSALAEAFLPESSENFLSKVIDQNRKVRAKGEITLPKEVREYLHVAPGDSVTILIENGEVILKNSMQYAFEQMHEIIADKIEGLGIENEEDAFEFVRRFRQDEKENGIQEENRYFPRH